MRKFLAVIFGLSVIASNAGGLHAQSGRTRSVTPADRSAETKTPADDQKDENGPAQASASAPVEAGDVLSVDVSLVTIPVIVRDREGRYAPDLTREDFRVFEDGVEQRIAYFATVDQPFTVALVLDTSGSTEFSIGDMQRAASSFVDQLKPADRVTVISFDDRIDVLCEPTSDRPELNRAIRRARGGGGTRLYDAVEYTLKKRLSQTPGRKAVVLLTDGVDTTSHGASYKSSIRLAEESDAIIYTVSYADLFRGVRPGVITQPRISLPGGITIGGGGGPGAGAGTSAADYARGDAYLNELAQKTGGRMYRGNSVVNISQAFEWVAEELRRQYSLGYYPKVAGKGGERRQIRVRVNRPELAVEARDGYVFSQKRAEEKQAGGDQSKTRIRRRRASASARRDKALDVCIAAFNRQPDDEEITTDAQFVTRGAAYSTAARSAAARCTARLGASAPVVFSSD